MLFMAVALIILATIIISVNMLVKKTTEDASKVIAEVTAQQLDVSKYQRTFEQLDVLTNQLRQGNNMKLHMAHAKY